MSMCKLEDDLSIRDFGQYVHLYVFADKESNKYEDTREITQSSCVNMRTTLI